MKILLIDDTLSLLNEIKDILVMEGHEVSTASNGYEGLEKIGKLIPDLIITDIVMPEMDGYQLIQKIKSLSKFKDIPVIVLSAQAARENKDKAFTLQAEKYLTKPCSIDELINAINEVTL